MNIPRTRRTEEKSSRTERGGSAGTSKPEAASRARRPGSETRAKPKRAHQPENALPLEWETFLIGSLADTLDKIAA